MLWKRDEGKQIRQRIILRGNLCRDAGGLRWPIQAETQGNSARLRSALLRCEVRGRSRGAQNRGALFETRRL